jgi:hypothetical protein
VAAVRVQSVRRQRVVLVDEPDGAPVFRVLVGCSAGLVISPFLKLCVHGKLTLLRTGRRRRILCAECGCPLHSLSLHLKTAHRMTPEAYREKHGLPAWLPLVSPSLSRQLSERASNSVLFTLSQVRVPRPNDLVLVLEDEPVTACR